jgi:cytidylate kinase
MRITISGPSGSGKSTTARELGKALGLKNIDVGQIFRAMAARRKMDVVAFADYAKTHPEVDREKISSSKGG